MDQAKSSCTWLTEQGSIVHADIHICCVARSVGLCSHGMAAHTVRLYTELRTGKRQHTGQLEICPWLRSSSLEPCFQVRVISQKRLYATVSSTRDQLIRHYHGIGCFHGIVCSGSPYCWRKVRFIQAAVRRGRTVVLRRILRGVRGSGGHRCSNPASRHRATGACEPNNQRAAGLDSRGTVLRASGREVHSGRFWPSDAFAARGHLREGRGQDLRFAPAPTDGQPAPATADAASASSN